MLVWPLLPFLAHGGASELLPPLALLLVLLCVAVDTQPRCDQLHVKR